MYPYFGIEILNNDLYTIKKIVSDTVVVPTNRRAYKTLDKALVEAEKLGIKIEVIGDFYSLFKKAWLNMKKDKILDKIKKLKTDGWSNKKTFAETL